MQDLRQFFEEQHFIDTKEEGTYQSSQWGASMQFAAKDSFDVDEADIVIVGCNEWRGETNLPQSGTANSADAIREQLYQLYNWHPGISVYDAGNIKQGASIGDTRAALRIVLHELQLAGKTVVVLGGAHDLTLQQYEAFKKTEKMIHASVADLHIDLDETEDITAHSYLMNMLTEQPNFVSHYNHIGFQSYYAHPRMVETLDKLRFDFYRLGKVREHIEDMEPVLRNSHLFSFDISAVKYSDAPVNVTGSPNGFTGDEACTLTRYAGMSLNLTSFGIFGYREKNDIHRMTAKLIAQMVWYFIDGYSIRKTEANLTERDEFMVFHVSFTDNDTVFLKSKRTNRWWMRLPNQSFVPCSYKDYQIASNDEIPERWLREQERMI
jgi:formiminoglutamase